MPRNWIVASIAVLALAAAPAAKAAQIKVLVSGAMAHALQDISEDFTKKNGHTLDFQVGTTGVVQDKVRMGEKADIVEVTSAGMDQLEKEKLVMPGTRVELARALIGVAVKDGSPVPDISTPAALKQRLMSARAVAYIDPKVGGQAGAAIVGMLSKMGITDDVAKKAVYGKTGAEAVQKMANGEADIAISFISEMMPIKGAKVVGTLPAALQNPSQYAAAIGSASANLAAARDLLKAMQSAEAHRVMVNAGLEPVTNGAQPITK
ncbi:MAG TPA: molybdate ABC transporter substrate-binding protein [Micropepsaceae bacterium]|nr:molybdate ABC transporter substrate-binding protein [Micropepsaceae bacterium]